MAAERTVANHHPAIKEDLESQVEAVDIFGDVAKVLLIDPAHQMGDQSPGTLGVMLAGDRSMFWIG